MDNLTVTGISLHQGTFDGTAYDYAKLYVLAPMEDKQGNKKGMNIVEYRSDSSLYQKLKQHDYPCEMDLKITMMSKGKAEMAVKVIDAAPSKIQLRKAS